MIFTLRPACCLTWVRAPGRRAANPRARSSWGNQIRSLREIHEILVKRVAAAQPPQQKKLALKLGVTQFFLGRTAEAVESLRTADGPLASFFLGRALVLRGDYAGALQAFEQAESLGYAAQQVQLQRAGALRLQGSVPEAKAILAKVKDMASHNAEYHFQEGGIAEADGDTPRAARSYERAVELDPNHSGALFRLAFLNDLAGNDFEAIQLYERCLKHPPIGKGVLYNLGVLYEDHGYYDKAADAYRKLAKADPLDERAKLFVKDAEASTSQSFSGDDEQISVQFRQVMEIPITDFELSVRSRNCLKRLNIRTLGDLTRVTEASLLASKNFGDTSLVEIQQIMEAKNLKIGQSLEQGQQYEFRARPQNNYTPEEQAQRSRPVSELNLSVRARKCMMRLNINTVGELCDQSSDTLMEAKNFGITSLNEVREKLTAMGLKLRND